MAAEIMVPLQNSRLHLVRWLRKQSIPLPLRSEGRRKHHVEKWVLFRLIATLAQRDKLTYPLEIQKSERPDFDLIQGGLTIGIEVTEALPANYAEHQILQEREFPEALMEPGHFRAGHVPRDTQRSILASGRLTAAPYMGDAVEQEWAKNISDAITGKCEKLAGFRPQAETWLLIKNSLPLHSSEIEKALRYLRPALGSIWSTKPTFERIYIDHGTNALIVLTPAQQHVEAILDLWWPRKSGWKSPSMALFAVALLAAGALGWIVFSHR